MSVIHHRPNMNLIDSRGTATRILVIDPVETRRAHQTTTGAKVKFATK